MAIERNDINFLNRVNISAVNNRRFLDDVRSCLFITQQFDISPTLLTSAKDLLDLKIEELTEASPFYKLIASAFSQRLNPIKLLVFGSKKNLEKTTMTSLYKEYSEHENGAKVFNIVYADDFSEKGTGGVAVETANKFYKSLVEFAKTNKEILFHIGVEKSKWKTPTEIYNLNTNTNLPNVAYYIEGEKNVKQGNWLVGAFVGGVIGAKELGSYIAHSSELIGFVQENYTPTEQQQFKEKGFNFVSKPTKGYFHLVNGIASDNKMYLDLKLAEFWLKDNLQKEITILQVTKDKLSFKNEQGIQLVRSTILSVCSKGARAGIFLTDNANNYFGVYSTKDKSGNQIDIKLGYLNMDALTQDNIREGLLNFDLMLTYDTGIRHVTLNGVITTDGVLLTA